MSTPFAVAAAAAAVHLCVSAGRLGCQAHRRLVAQWQFAAKGFNHHLRQFLGCKYRSIIGPRQHTDAIACCWGHPLQSRGIVHIQMHSVAPRGQLCTQSPTHAQVAVVVHHATENCPWKFSVYPIHSKASIVILRSLG